MGNILIDLTNQHFGKLTVLYYDKNKHKWVCQCECGNIKYADGSRLRRGSYQSCGCLRKTNLVGQKFGYLTVLSDSGERTKNRQILWNCQCKCGNIVKVRTDNLKTNNTMSCGCLKTSNQEYIIEQLLLKNNIKYKKEYVFKDLLSSKNGYLRFDFAILNEDNSVKYLIEYDGETHDPNHVLGWNTSEKIKYQLECDELKNKYCQNHHIPLIRLNYTKNKITLNDLLLKQENNIYDGK